MESQPQNPEFRNNPENFHPCIYHNLQCAYITRVMVNVLKYRTLSYFCIQIKCWFLGLDFIKSLSE